MSAENSIAKHEIVYDQEKNRIYITKISARLEEVGKSGVDRILS